MKLKKIIAGTAIIIVFFFIGTKKVEGAGPTVCGDYGQPCCGSTTNKYCNGENLVCGTNNICQAMGGGTVAPIDERESGRADDVILPQYSADSGFRWANASLGEIISELIKYVYLFAGLALIIVLLFGGFTVLTAAGVPEKAQVGYTRITQGLIGFVVIFASYLVVLLVEAILKINIF
ncbi:MAG TPA: hypothetical protein P5299_01465 [Candidatus Woesebacteria bacterium]|nr:hypothetical protein [Candidatus Woesebacteria bacterium]